MKTTKYVVLVFFVFLVIIQFIPGSLPESSITVSQTEVMPGTPQEIITILSKSCFDCHSNQTDYPFYSKIAPASWLISNHIKNGRAELNFSTWEDLSKRRKIGMLGEIAETIEEGEMPLPSYILMHKAAKLSPEQMEKLIAWTENQTEIILNQ